VNLEHWVGLSVLGLFAIGATLVYFLETRP
jgi:hypothetical protein